MSSKAKQTVVKEPELFEPVKPEPTKKGREVAVSRSRPAAPPAPMEATSVNLMRMLADVAQKGHGAEMEKVLDVIERVKKEEARMAFTSAMLKMKPNLPSIARDGSIVIADKNNANVVKQRTPFATYENIHRVVTPILTQHGFVYTCSTEPGADGKLNTIGQLDHVAGHFTRSIFPLPADTTGSKNNVQGWGSAAKYGRRYNIIQLLDIVSHHPGDADRDGRAPGDGAELADDDGTLSFDEAQELSEAIKVSGLTFDKFYAKYGIKAVNLLPRAKLEEAKQAVAAFAETARRARKAKDDRR